MSTHTLERRPTRPATAGAAPTHLVVGPPDHGIARHSRALARSLGALVVGPVGLHPSGQLRHPPRPSTDGRAPALHLHASDHLLARQPEAAAHLVEALSRTYRLTLTLHDVPTPEADPDFVARAHAYRRMSRAARAVAVVSQHDLRAMEQYVGVLRSTVAVLPVPLLESPVATDDSESSRSPSRIGDHPTAAAAGRVGIEVGVLGREDRQGLLEVLEAAGLVRSTHRAPQGIRLVVLGGSAAALVDAHLRRRADELGVEIEIAVGLDDDELLHRCRVVDVPVAPVGTSSAASALSTWLAAGRRPLVPRHGYSLEAERLRPGAHRLLDRGDAWDVAIEQAVTHPSSTHAKPAHLLSHGLDEVAEAYLTWWNTLSEHPA